MTGMSTKQIGVQSRERILRYLLSFTLEQWPPSLRQIGEAVDLRSPSSVLHHVRILEAEGFIERGSGDRQIRVKRDLEHVA